MHIRLRFVPPVTIMCVSGFVAILAVCALLVPATKSISDDFLSNYGRALSTMAAKQAVDAAFNHDLVRLQVILQDVVENQHTLLATIHDVENNLLVQAGDPRTAASRGIIFSSPIVLHDSITGYVSVTLNTEPWSMDSLIALVIAISVLLLALAIGSLFQNGALDWSQKSRIKAPSEDADSTSQSMKTEIKSVIEPHHESVYGVIHIKNLHVLRQQVNGPSFRETTARLEKIITDVLALYGGYQFRLVDNYYVLEFRTQEDRGEALFHATCSAHLILELAGIINKIPLDLAALVSANEEDLVPEKLPFAGLILEAAAGSEDLINRRIKFVELGTEDGRRVLAGFRQPFQSLLENQRKQLGRIL